MSTATHAPGAWSVCPPAAWVPRACGWEQQHDGGGECGEAIYIPALNSGGDEREDAEKNQKFVCLSAHRGIYGSI
jgi:hypothetical protein